MEKVYIPARSRKNFLDSSGNQNRSKESKAQLTGILKETFLGLVTEAAFFFKKNLSREA